MPKGILWLKWDFKDGVVIDWKFPDSLEFDKKDISKIFSTQTYGNMNLPRYASFSTESINIVSFFGGRTNTDMVVLILNENEDAKNFERPLVSFYFNILQGNVNEISSAMELNKYFDIKQKGDSDLAGSDDKFGVIVNLFQNFVETIDRRLIYIEDFIININRFIQNLGKDNEGI